MPCQKIGPCRWHGSVNIGAAAYDAIYGSNGLKNRNGGADFAAAQANARNGVYYDISGSVTASASGDAKIGVRYNALTDQLILNGVAQGAGGCWELSGEGGALLVNPGRPIPPITQAIHHILDEQVADAPYWHDVARRVLDPWPRRRALADALLSGGGEINLTEMTDDALLQLVRLDLHAALKE